MSKFQFRLETVLQHRAARENSAEQTLALANKEYFRRVNKLEDTKKHLEEVINKVDVIEVDLCEVMHLSLYQASMTTKISGQERDVSVAGVVVTNRRNEAVKARQQRQVMEKLKDNHFQRYKKEEEDVECKEIDEIATQAHLRRRRQLNYKAN